MKKLLLPLAAAFLLAACDTPQTNYFTLPAKPKPPCAAFRPNH